MASPARAERDDDEPTPDVADLEESRMPFLSHLKELRDRVRNAAIAFVLAFGVCFYFSQEIYDWLEAPVAMAWRANPKLGEFKMTFATLTEPFWVNMSVALWAGIFLASPFIFYQIWRFIAPGLYKRERKIGVFFAVFSAVFFVSGALFCYELVLNQMYKFLLDYSSEKHAPTLMLQGYLDLTRDMMLAFGAVFEMPLLIFFLSMIGMVTHRGLWKFNRWFVVLAFIIGAILTPSPDVVSQLLMAAPMIVLYNLSILVSWYVTVQREKKEAVLRDSEAAADALERTNRPAGKTVDDEDEED